MTTPCLRLFSAELTNAFRRSCDRLTRRNVDSTHNPTEIRKPQTTRPPISISQTNSGSAAPRWLRRLGCGPKAAKAQKAATRHTTTPAGIVIPPRACQFLPAIGHPQIYGASVWLHGFGLGKRVPKLPSFAAGNCGNCRDMINGSLMVWASRVPKQIQRVGKTKKAQPKPWARRVVRRMNRVGQFPRDIE